MYGDGRRRRNDEAIRLDPWIHSWCCGSHAISKEFRMNNDVLNTVELKNKRILIDGNELKGVTEIKILKNASQPSIVEVKFDCKIKGLDCS